MTSEADQAVKSDPESKATDDLLAVIEAAELRNAVRGIPTPAGLPRLRAWVERVEQRLDALEKRK